MGFGRDGLEEHSEGAQPLIISFLSYEALQTLAGVA